MGWGWILLIVVLVLLALPLFIPIIVRVRAASDPREFEYAVALGPFTLLPDLGENLSRYRRAVGRPLYIITRPIVWLFKGIGFLVIAVLWPFRTLFRLFRRKPKAGVSEEFEQVDYPADAAEPEEREFVEPEGYQPESTAHREPRDVYQAGDREAFEEPSEPDDDPETEFFEPPGIAPAAEEQPLTGKRSRIKNLFIKARAGWSQLRDLLSRYGRTGRRTIRAALLLGRESFQALNFRVFDLRWSTGGDPATLGQILGWHYMLTGALHPRLQRHLHFQPDWDSEQLVPVGRVNVVLYVWGYRFIPPLVRFVFRMPWIGVYRIVREQVIKRK